MKRIRLLELLLERFPEDGRKALYSRVLCGEIAVNGATERDPKRLVNRDADIEFHGSGYVGRGAHKLVAAIEAFELPCAGAIVLDAGSSTGGFSETLLRHGAARVYAVDVGTNQLAWKLRSDSRVVAMEERNISGVSKTELDPVPDFAVCDLSFRSLSGIALHIASLTRSRRVVALAKPQFERAVSAKNASYPGATVKADPQQGHFNSEAVAPETGGEFSGVVDDAEGKAIIDSLTRRLAEEGLVCLGMCQSPIRGRRGNREYFLDLAIEVARDDL